MRRGAARRARRGDYERDKEADRGRGVGEEVRAREPDPRREKRERRDRKTKAPAARKDGDGDRRNPRAREESDRTQPAGHGHGPIDSKAPRLRTEGGGLPLNEDAAQLRVRRGRRRHVASEEEHRRRPILLGVRAVRELPGTPRHARGVVEEESARESEGEEGRPEASGRGRPGGGLRGAREERRGARDAEEESLPRPRREED